MLRFCGFDLELLVDDVISREEWPALCEAHDEAGAHWLIVQVDDDQDHPAWLCAPVSQRAIRAVLDDGASPHDVLRHSATGTVELVSVAEGRAIPDRCLLCSELDERLSFTRSRPGGPDLGATAPGATAPATSPAGPTGPVVQTAGSTGNTALTANPESTDPARAFLAA